MTGAAADGTNGHDLPALAAACGVPPTVVQSWLDAGLLRAQRAAGGPRFPFAQLAVARTLAQLRAAGWRPARIHKALQAARRVVPDPAQALAGLLASVGQRRLVVRTPDGRLVEPGGQQLFDFGAGGGGGTVHGLRSPRAWHDAGLAAEAEDRLEEAVLAYERALPAGLAETRFNLGNCLWALGRKAEAKAQFAAAVALVPDHAEGWNNLGIVLGDLGEVDDAVAAFQRALVLVPWYADAHYNLAPLLQARGDVEGARRHWRAYLSYDPNSRWAEQVRARLQSLGP